jgi:hypothetical protein
MHTGWLTFVSMLAAPFNRERAEDRLPFDPLCSGVDQRP